MDIEAASSGVTKDNSMWRSCNKASRCLYMAFSLSETESRVARVGSNNCASDHLGRRGRGSGCYVRPPTRLVRVGPMIRRIAGTPLGIDSDFDSGEAVLQALCAQGLALSPRLESSERGLAHAGRSPGVGVWAANAVTLFAVYFVYQRYLTGPYAASEYVGVLHVRNGAAVWAACRCSIRDIRSQTAETRWKGIVKRREEMIPKRH